MDDIYAPYLRLCSFDFDREDEKDTRTAGERIAEGLFFSISNMGKYYRNRLVTILYDEVVKDIYPTRA